MKHAAWPALLVPATLVLLSACSADPAGPVGPGATPSLSRAAAAPGAESVPIPGQYIVVFRDAVADAPGLARRLAAAQGSSPRHVYEHALKGFVAPMSAQAAAALARNPNVAYVEQDQVVTASATVTQNNATWGLDRIDQRALPLSTTYSYSTTATGVTVYIIDTGIRTTHNEFGGRARSGVDEVDGGAADDCNGHGTHVAGTVGGSTYGVAKGVALVAVRVLDCQGSGSWGDVIAGIDWVTANHQSPAVANMSLGGGASASVDQAVQSSIASGVTYAIAAGNGNRAGIAQDACNYSPARVAEAITVGATTKTDAKASYSNYGSCVDFFAPGSGITSAWNTSNTATNTISGTSMATPHVAGAAALYLAAHTGATPQQVRDALYAATTKDVVTSSNTANNDLLYTLDGSVEEPPPPSGGITLAVTMSKSRGSNVANLSWSGASGGSVDIWRDGSNFTATANDGAYADNLGKGGGSHSYQVCLTGSSTSCSNTVTVSF
jgi:subtilisin family serine protease